MEELLRRILARLIESGLEVIAPVRDGEHVRLRPIRDPAEAELGALLVDTPLKEWLFPASETLLDYRLEGRQPVWKSRLPEIPERVVVGVRPCDAAALPLLDAVFGWDGDDPWYRARRERTLVLATACPAPEAACFCTSVGLAPNSARGADLLLAPGKGGAPVLAAEELASPRTRRLAELLDGLAPLVAAAELPPPAAAPEPLFAADPAAALPDAVYGEELWREVGRRCLACGACAFACPTCHCFDVTDEGPAAGGRRKRCWDSCCTSLFTLHAGAHNPRREPWRRYRQRVLHKFHYYPQRFGALLCTGCGRCIRVCPAGVDIAEQAARVLAAAAAAGAGAGKDGQK